MMGALPARRSLDLLLHQWYASLIVSSTHSHATSECVVSLLQYSISGKVPGDLITDLQNAGLIGDPLYELNWLNASMWDAHEVRPSIFRAEDPAY